MCLLAFMLMAGFRDLAELETYLCTWNHPEKPLKRQTVEVSARCSIAKTPTSNLPNLSDLGTYDHCKYSNNLNSLLVFERLNRSQKWNKRLINVSLTKLSLSKFRRKRYQLEILMKILLNQKGELAINSVLKIFQIYVVDLVDFWNVLWEWDCRNIFGWIARACRFVRQLKAANCYFHRYLIVDSWSLRLAAIVHHEHKFILRYRERKHGAVVQ